MRIQFAIPLWTRYQDLINQIMVTEEMPLVHTDLLLNCHLCGNCFNYRDLLSHIEDDHGTDHVPDCGLCRVLLHTKPLEDEPER